MSGLTWNTAVMNLAVSWGLFLLIWLVQLIIYPGFERIPAKDFMDYHPWYVRRISTLVMPLMIGEVLAAAWWLFWADYSPVSVVSAFLVLIVWLSTFTLQVPLHHRLRKGKNGMVIRRLVNTNWIRTIAWSMKATLVTVAIVYGPIQESGQ